MEISQDDFEAEKRRSFLEGKLQGIYDYAWSKDGILYVGTTGKTYQEAAKEIRDEIAKIKK